MKGTPFSHTAVIVPFSLSGKVLLETNQGILTLLGVPPRTWTKAEHFYSFFLRRRICAMWATGGRTSRRSLEWRAGRRCLKESKKNDSAVWPDPCLFPCPQCSSVNHPVMSFPANPVTAVFVG